MSSSTPTHTSSNAIAGPSTPKTTDPVTNRVLPAGSVKEKKEKAAEGGEVGTKNVFKNDGSFLQRFAKPKEKTAEEKKAEAIAQKKATDDKFKRRGKRPLPPPTEGEERGGYKKVKPELTAYEKEVAKYESRMLKDAGSGVRSIMK